VPGSSGPVVRPLKGVPFVLASGELLNSPSIRYSVNAREIGSCRREEFPRSYTCKLPAKTPMPGSSSSCPASSWVDHGRRPCGLPGPPRVKAARAIRGRVSPSG
jgi:hypothetical protein